MFNKKLWKRKTMNNYKKLESGRSMIEMLGVLAIIGVLSVGGIAGYSKAMNKFKTNKVADNVSMLVANIKTLYAQQNTYTGLSNVTAYSMGVVPDELKGVHTAAQEAEGTPDTEGYKPATAESQELINSFSGQVYINVSDSTISGDKKAFVIEFTQLSREACITLATNDWGSGYSSGLIALRAKGNAEQSTAPTSRSTDLDGVYIGNAGSAAAGSATATPGGTVAVPLSVVSAANACNCTKGNTCSLLWKYY